MLCKKRLEDLESCIEKIDQNQKEIPKWDIQQSFIDCFMSFGIIAFGLAFTTESPTLTGFFFACSLFCFTGFGYLLLAKKSKERPEENRSLELKKKMTKIVNQLKVLDRN